MLSSLRRIHNEFDFRPTCGNFQCCQNFNGTYRRQWMVNRHPNRNFHQNLFLQLHKPTRSNGQQGKAFAKTGWIYFSYVDLNCQLNSVFRLDRTLFLSSGPKQISLITPIILWSTGLCLLFGFHLSFVGITLVCQCISHLVSHIFLAFLHFQFDTKLFQAILLLLSWPGRKRPGSLTNRSPVEAWMTRSSRSIWSPTQPQRPLAFQVSKSQWTVCGMIERLKQAHKHWGRASHKLLHTYTFTAQLKSALWYILGRFGEDDYPFMRGMMDMALGVCNEEMFIKVMFLAKSCYVINYHLMMFYRHRLELGTSHLTELTVRCCTWVMLTAISEKQSGFRHSKSKQP